MRTPSIVPALVTLLAFAGCRDTAASTPDPLAGLTLDNGKRWSADEHTGRSVRAMAEAVRRVAEKRDAAATRAQR